ncbi:MAG: alpha/beta fold hydrolase [Acidobacteriota bacterium]
MIRRPLALTLTVLVASFCLSSTASARFTERGGLARRALLGIQFQPGPDGHPSIQGVFPDTTAAAAGFETGDVLLKIDDTAVSDAQSIGRVLSQHRAGDRMSFLVRRGDEEKTLRARLRPRPHETVEELDLVHDVVVNGSARLRALVTRPEGKRGPLPAVLFVQGLSCGSIENGPGPANNVTQLVHGLSRAGFVVMRVEKHGVGDSIGGTPCSEIGFHDEVEGFRKALAKLRSYRFVDPNQVLLFGHSMGGVQAPILAADGGVRGVAVFGTAIYPWAEYLVNNSRRQALLSPEVDHVALEARLRRMARFYHHFFRDGLEMDAIVKAHPELEEVAREAFPDGVHGYTRHVRFFRELDALNMAEVWANVPVPVLAMSGEYDFATSAAAHRYLIDIVNQDQPGQARHVDFPKMFHAFNKRDSMEQTLAAPWQGPFGTELLTTTVDWAREVLAPGAS